MEFRYPLELRPRVVSFGISLDGVDGEVAEGEPLRGHSFDTVALPARLLPAAWQSEWSPALPPVVFTGPGFGELTGRLRDFVWERWGVCVYEHRLDDRGRLLAVECDAHEALHLLHADGIEPQRCACGEMAPLLLIETTAASGAESAMAGHATR